MAPEKNCWGAGVVKVPRVSGVQECLSYSLKRVKEKDPRFYDVLTMHGNSGADEGASKNYGGYSPLQAPRWRHPCLKLAFFQNCSKTSVLLSL